MKVLVIGRTGQLARELIRRAPPDVRVTALGRDQADLGDPDRCAAVIAACDADAVINAAAYTAVDRAESEPALAMTVNAEAPGAMARAAAARGLPFLHVSSDYVFDGLGSNPFLPDTPGAPLSVYGQTKLAGEDQVRAAAGNALILRTSWVFSAHGANFVKSILHLGATRDALNVVSDQVGGPTPAAAIADALILSARAMVRGAPGGTHHFAGAPDTSWADFARAIMSAAGLLCRITDIATAMYPTPARRPLNSRLDCSSFARQFGIERPNWQAGLRDVLVELGVSA
jgi:dTDP-4-dehydrorhamnose reductase